MRWRTGHGIKIPQQNNGRAVAPREPIGARQSLRLQTPFAPAETEVRVDKIHGAEVGLHIDSNRRPLFPAEKWRRTRETFGAPQSQRMPAEDRMATMSIALLHRRVEIAMPPELLRDRARLVDPRRSFPAEIELLETDHVHLHLRDHLRDPRLGALAVHADAAVHIVGRDSQSRL